MLFKEKHLQGIKTGQISLAFRRWEKVSVKKGSSQKTSIGLVNIVDISTIKEKDITGEDSIDAGFKNREELLQSLRRTDNGMIYKIKVRYHSEDPRIILREQTAMPNEYFFELKDKLERLDKFSKQGDWTKKILLTIKDHPHKRAVELSQLTGYEKTSLKLNIRKLKNLGLTISHSVGYELSPLGKVFLEKLLIGD